MWTLLKQLWTDPAAFLAAVRQGGAWLRMAVVGLGLAIQQGAIPIDSKWGWWGGLVAVILGVGIGHGDKTPSLVTQFAGLNPDEKATIKAHLG